MNPKETLALRLTLTSGSIRDKNELLRAGTVPVAAAACHNYMGSIIGRTKPHEALHIAALGFFDQMTVGGGYHDANCLERRRALAREPHVEEAALCILDAFPEKRERVLGLLYSLSKVEPMPRGGPTFDEFWARGGDGHAKYGFTAEEALRHGSIKLTDGGCVPGQVGMLPRGAQEARQTEAVPGSEPPQQFAISDEAFYTNGSRVVVRRLVSAPELNGRSGVVEAFDATSCRFTVRLHPSGIASEAQGRVAVLQNERVINVKATHLDMFDLQLHDTGAAPERQDMSHLSHAQHAITKQAMQDFMSDLRRMLDDTAPQAPVCVRNGTCVMAELDSVPQDVVTGIKGMPDMEPENVVYRVPVAGVGGFIYAVVYRGRGLIKLATVYRKTVGENEKLLKVQFRCPPRRQRREMRCVMFNLCSCSRTAP